MAMKGKMRKKNKIVFTLKIFFACCFIISVVIALKLYHVEYQEEKKIKVLKAIHDDDNDNTESKEESSQSFLELSALNQDYFGWLTVEGTRVSLPVVLGEDNEFYLKHDFYKNDSTYGTLFADCLTNQESEGNLLIYGHNMKNDSMFGSLENFCDEDFFNENSLACVEQEDGKHYYEIFAVLIVSGYEEREDYLPIRDYLDTQNSEYLKEILATLKERAIQWRDSSFFANDKFLFLVTCDYTKENGRLLLCGRCKN
jgi:sortase B